MDLRAGKPFGRLKGSVGAIRDIAHPTEPLVAVVGLDRYLRGKIPPPGAENSRGKFNGRQKNPAGGGGAENAGRVRLSRVIDEIRPSFRM